MTAFQRKRTDKRATDWEMGDRFVLFSTRHWDRVWTVTRIEPKLDFVFAELNDGTEERFDHSEFDDMVAVDNP